MLDCSPEKIERYAKRYNYNFAQLRTPLTCYALSGKLYGLDNGCFTTFKKKTWLRLLNDAKNQEIIKQPKFVCAPDVVGNHVLTEKQFFEYYETIKPLKTCLVLQDGIKEINFWDKVDAVFVGGSDKFKLSKEAVSICKEAKSLGKWVHIGRVNTAVRVRNWLGIADSIDGSGISKYDHMLENVLFEIMGDTPQTSLEL